MHPGHKFIVQGGWGYVRQTSGLTIKGEAATGILITTNESWKVRITVKGDAYPAAGDIVQWDRTHAWWFVGEDLVERERIR